MVSKRDKRKSGLVQQHRTIRMKIKDMINECLEPLKHYSDWDDWRDGCRELKGHSRKKKKPWNPR